MIIMTMMFVIMAQVDKTIWTVLMIIMTMVFVIMAQTACFRKNRKYYRDRFNDWCFMMTATVAQMSLFGKQEIKFS